MRIAVLLSQKDTAEFTKRFVDDGEKFIRLMKVHRPHWQYDNVPVMDGVFPTDFSNYDGFVITGSTASVHDDALWIGRLEQLIIEIDHAQLPLFGACFGHQIIAKALGGKVGNNPHGWSLGTAVTEFYQNRPWMTPHQASVNHCLLYTSPSPRDS